MHNNLPIHLTFFDSFHDNAAKSVLMSWGEIASMLSAPHATALSHKSMLPLFSPWRYKDVSDSTVSNGLTKESKPLHHFSDTHVRRIEANLLEMSMMVLDFDGGLTIEEAKQAFHGVESVGYTTYSHQTKGKDMFRLVMPYEKPMPVEQALLHKDEISEWAFAHGADKSTADIGRMFILPAVQEEHRHLAQSWYQAGELLDWDMFDSMLKPTSPRSFAKTGSLISQRTERRLMPDDVLETASGPVVVRDINRKISNVRCPFHHDAKPTEFVAVTNRCTPYLVCKKCGTVYMERKKDDGIAAGIARINAKKARRDGGVQ